VMVYHWAEQDYLKGYAYHRSTDRMDADHPIVGPVLALGGPNPNDTIMPGGMTSLSADRTSGGVLWAIIASSATLDPRYGQYPGRLYAFDALTLRQLAQVDIPTIPKWMPATVADGKVFVPTSSKQVQVLTLGPASESDR
jgi:hypothetical protein